MAKRKPKPPAAELLTVKEAAAMLGVHEDTVHRQIARGALTAVRIGRAVRLQRSELMAYIHGGGDAAAEPKPIPPDYVRALHAKANAIDIAQELSKGTTKKRILAAASKQFGRAITSTLDLSLLEGDWVLDRLTEAQAELGLK